MNTRNRLNKIVRQQHEKRISPIKRLFTVFTLLAVCLAALVGPTSAQAASGGGCGETAGLNGTGFWKACISAPAYGYAVPDAYIHLYEGHPPCTVTIQAYIWFIEKLVSDVSYVCPDGEFDGRMIGPGFYGDSIYYAVVRINYDWSTAAYSWRITLP